MIILRQAEFAKNNKGGGGDDVKKYTQKQMEDAGKQSYDRGRRDAYREFRKRSEKAKKRAKTVKNIEEYTGLDDLKKWAKKKEEGLKTKIKENKQGIRKGFKYGAIGVATGAAVYGGYKVGKKIYQNQKDKKKSERIRKKVRGYDSD